MAHQFGLIALRCAHWCSTQCVLFQPLVCPPAAELPAAAAGAERHSGRRLDRREPHQGVLLKLRLPVRASEGCLYAICVFNRHFGACLHISKCLKLCCMGIVHIRTHKWPYTHLSFSCTIADRDLSMHQSSPAPDNMPVGGGPRWRRQPDQQHHTVGWRPGSLPGQVHRAEQHVRAKQYICGREWGILRVHQGAFRWLKHHLMLFAEPWICQESKWQINTFRAPLYLSPATLPLVSRMHVVVIASHDVVQSSSIAAPHIAGLAALIRRAP